MQILDRIENQMSATGLPLVGITLAAVPCPDTPVILTLHWHGFIRQKLVELEEAEAVAYTADPEFDAAIERTLARSGGGGPRCVGCRLEARRLGCRALGAARLPASGCRGDRSAGMPAGHERLKFIAKNFRYSLWLNPKLEIEWPYSRTIGIIQEIFPMYELTLDGLDKAVKYMMSKN